MKIIEVHDQVSLPLRRCFQLCVHGIRYRLFRSIITVGIVTLAVSFLMMMLSTSYIDREVGADVRSRLSGQRLLADWVDKLSGPMTGEALSVRLARARPGTPAWDEFKALGSLSEADLAEIVAVARRRQQHERFLASVKPGERSALVGTRTGDAVFTYLARDAELLRDFYRGLASQGRLLPTGKAEFEKLLSDFTRTAPRRAAIQAAHAARVQALANDLGKEPVLDLLARGPLAGPVLRKHGFLADDATLDRLGRQAKLDVDAQELTKLLNDRWLRGQITQRSGVAAPSPDELFGIVAGSRGARWLIEQVAVSRDKAAKRLERSKQILRQIEELQSAPAGGIASAAAEALKAPAGGKPAPLAEAVAGLVAKEVEKESKMLRDAFALKAGVNSWKLVAQDAWKAVATERGAAWLLAQLPTAHEKAVNEVRDAQEGLLPPLRLPAERIAEVAGRQIEAVALAEAESYLPDVDETGWFGFSSRTAWLIVISFVVCAVGVTNAMLMSVTERFREIATMKCLGALDSFIMIIFVMESSLQGLTGGAVGVVLGLLLGLVRSAWGFGALAFVNLPVLAVVGSAGVCAAAGVVLAALAAVYPAWVAARLAPMEAMRVE